MHCFNRLLYFLGLSLENARVFVLQKKIRKFIKIYRIHAKYYRNFRKIYRNNHLDLHQERRSALGNSIIKRRQMCNNER